MNICFVTDNVFSLGGVQRVVSVLANELVKKHNVDILCISNRNEINRKLYELDENINVIIDTDIFKKNILEKIVGKIGKIINERSSLLNNDSMVKILRNIYFPRSVRKKAIKRLNSKNYDVIIGVEGIFSILLGIISEDLNSKLIGWQHNSYDAYFNTYKRYYWKQDILFKNYLKKLDKYVVLTDFDRDEVNNKFEINSVRIYNPLSFNSKEKSNLMEKNILFVGRLVEEQKGLDLLIETFNVVNKFNKEWILHIVGDGPDLTKLENLISEFELNNYVFIHPFTDNIQKYYLNSTIFLSTSRWEGFGLVITEAMECGVPVIAFDNSGPREIINKNKINGILVEKNNTIKMANEIINLINDKSYILELSKNSIIRANDYSVKSIAKEWEGLMK
ncbi:TPA: glycosyltransferase family 4 protein [Clostridium perfringens]|uniref:glycosyltransferase family 4 protein n=1 Tax=Clostridium perfringens TaxID=1502 RepID=UPI001A25DBFC|nr:glycosyltransferase family 4 protein [Clostridium perfringens]UBK66658.1 glycosyltransferase family 4 protein [Clostridium perfringens]HAT4202274.1 glycosyltransferase family 4 protein [Clostridium perfringens]